MTVNPSSFTIDLERIPVNVPISLSAVDTDTIINSHAWYFGDGFTASGPIVQHAYVQPGIYDIKHVVCDYNNVTYATTREVTAYMAVKDAVTMALGQPLTAGIASPLVISVTSSQLPINVQLYISGSNSTAPRQAMHVWDHLLPRWGFYDLDDTMFQRALFTTTVQPSAITINDSIVGYYGTACINVVDDLPGNVNIFATLTQQQIGAINSRSYAALSGSVAALEPSANTRLAITHDGINEWRSVQYAGTLIPVVVTVYDSRVRYPHIVHDVFLQGTNVVTLSSSLGQFTIANDQYETAQHCTSAAPYFKTIMSSCVTGNDVVVSAQLSVTANSVHTLTGSTIPIQLLPLTDISALRRFNESYDFSTAIKHYMPEFMVSLAPSAFNAYFPAIFGNGQGDMQRDIGAKIIERVTNFFDNHGDVDTCGIDQVADDCQAFSVNATTVPFNVPAEIKRMLDITSINQQRLWGTKCSCNTTFDDCQSCCDDGLKCTLCKQSKRLNRGDRIDTTTYVVTAGVPIIYNPNNTDIFQLLHTIPVSGNLSYAISAIDFTGLIEPIDSNYNWFHYLPTPSGNDIESIINWKDCNTTLPRDNTNSWLADQGTVEQIFRFYLANVLQRDPALQCAAPQVDCPLDVCR